MLRDAGVSFTIDPTLVRGFDYYTDTLWEVTAGGLGSQNAIGGGGRYDNLVESLGGKPTPGVGFGSGIERLLLALEAQAVAVITHARPLVWLVHYGEAAKAHNFTLIRELRTAGVRTDTDLTGRSPKSQFKLADAQKADFCIVVGDDELAQGVVKLKNMQTGEQQAVPRAQVVQTLRS
jgi:histidyl-tRNA synthetase